MTDEQRTDPTESGTPDDRPDWLNPRYDSVEAQAKAYAEAEKRISELSEKAKYAESLEENYGVLAAEVEQLKAQQIQTAQQQAQSPLVAAYQDAYERGDAAQMLAVQAEISKLATQEALRSALPQVQQQVASLADSQAAEIGAYATRTLEARYGDAWEQNKDAISHVLDTQPWLIPEEAKTNPQVAVNALDNVFKIATHGNVQPTANAQAAEAEAERARLLALQTATGSGVRQVTGDEAKAAWSEIKAAGDRPYWAGLNQ